MNRVRIEESDFENPNWNQIIFWRTLLDTAAFSGLFTCVITNNLNQTLIKIDARDKKLTRTKDSKN
jgi:hypothetical protein